MSARVLLGWALAWPLLVGPAPGSVGGCGESSAPVDAETFCRARQGQICEREFQRGLRGLSVAQTEAERDACLERAVARCAGARFPAACQPSDRDLDRCVGALASVARLAEPSAAIAECRSEVFCRTPAGQASPPAPDGGAP